MELVDFNEDEGVAGAGSTMLLMQHVLNVLCSNKGPAGGCKSDLVATLAEEQPKAWTTSSGDDSTKEATKQLLEGPVISGLRRWLKGRFDAQKETCVHGLLDKPQYRKAVTELATALTSVYPLCVFYTQAPKCRCDIAP